MRRQVTTIISVVGLALGPGAVAAAAQQSPDARDANLAAQQSGAVRTSGDLRSPDARDAALAAQQAPVAGIADPRSPDARDAATGVRIPSVTVTPVVAKPADDGFQWGDAGIGAGTIAVLVLLALGAGVAVQHHHRRQPGAPLAG